MNIKTEIWNGHKIRFIEKNLSDWWAVLADITKALELSTKHVRSRLEDEVVSTDHVPDSLGRIQEMLIVNEYGIYETVFESRKKEAKDFKRWVFEMLKQLREASGLEGFEIFRMLDKDHQKEMMDKLNVSFQQPVKVDFIKANTIANKATSTAFGYPKMIKKDQMTPDMLMRRQQVLDDTVNLMLVSEKFGLKLSISELVYQKYLQ